MNDYILKVCCICCVVFCKNGFEAGEILNQDNKVEFSK